jgi:uncharacterized protein (TIGR02453 family)
MKTSTAPPTITPRTFAFLRDLALHNDRPWFEANKDRYLHGPVFYLHLQPGTVFSAAGIWRPPPETLAQVRDAIVAHPERWRRVTRACPLSELEGDRLKRVPRGYAPDHSLADDLKRLSFTTATRFTQRDACAPGFLDRFEQACRKATPLMEFLTSVVGLRW